MNISWDDSGLKKLQHNLDSLKKAQSIPITDLMPDSFIQQHSHFQSFQALVDASGIKDPNDIGNESFSQFIANNTTFPSWDEMEKVAGAEYIKHKLGF
jgi:hypothetical protein